MASNLTHHMRPTLALESSVPTVKASHARGALARTCVLAMALAIACALSLASAIAVPWQRAYAEDIDTNPTPDELQLEVERTAAQLEEARARVEEAQTGIQENSARIAELEELLPAQQARSDAAVRELYIGQQQSFSIIEILLSSETLSDFLSNLEYINQVSRSNMAEIQRTRAMQAELLGAQEELEATLQEAEASAVEAEQALTAAQEARAEAQRRAEEAARQAAEQEAAAQAAAAAAAAAAQAAAEEQQAAAQAPSAEQAAAAQSEASAEVAQLVSDGADWSADQDAFVAEWSARIDAYLAGSPLAGQGRTFAVAAWNYGVDPRWSPAIAYTESSLGAACFLPHNAWGWGSESWGSWEEAIDAHVRGLARGYGYTISLDAAKKYCPPNYQHWYERTLGQMNLI